MSRLGYIAGSSEIQTYYVNNNTVNFYLQGNETYWFFSANKPVYLKNNIFLMPQGTSLVNDGMNGGANVFKTNNIELYSNSMSYFDNQLHFQDIYSNDFHLTENSAPARNQGIEYTGAMNFDLDSVPVPQETTRDIGTFEFMDGGQTTNNPPVIANQTFSAPENSAAGSTVGTVVASDPDAGQTITYSIISGNTGNAFQINAASGVLSVATQAALNFETIPSFALGVRVQDNGSGSLSSQATITVNLTNVNEVPVIANQSFSVPYNSAVGTAVGTVLATDPDAGQTLTYSIVSGNTSNAFSIGAATGQLTVASTAAINLNPSFALVVRAQDNGTGSLYSQATMTITVTGGATNSPPYIAHQYFSLQENAAAGTTVGTVVATDPDPGQTLTFSITSGNTDNAFQIDPSTGVITVVNASAINYEINPEFILKITVQDNGFGNLTDWANATVDLINVNENPIIGNQMFTVALNVPLGTAIGTVLATDPDLGQTLTYSIQGGNYNKNFVISASAGVIRIKSKRGLYTAITNTFNLTVRVTDNGTGNLWSEAVVTIQVINGGGKTTGGDYISTNPVKSLETPSNTDFTLYPNPFVDKIKVEFESAGSENVTISIAALTGQVIYNKEFSTEEGTFAEVIDLNHLERGFYIVNVMRNGILKSEKLVKQ